MKKLMFLFLATTCVSSGIFGVKETEEENKKKGENTIELNYYNENNENKNNSFEKMYPDLKNLNEHKVLEKKSKPTALTIATFSLAMNSFLGFMTQTLSVSENSSVLIFFTANYGLRAWYQSRITKKSFKSDKKHEKNFGFKIKPYCGSTHWYSALPSFLLSSALAYKIMNFGSGRASKYPLH